MPSGGHARSGPPPDPNALRRERDKAEWRHLPAAGRQGTPPAWPLTRPTARELHLWAEAWRRPQAVMWEASGQFQEVALFVRALKDAEMPKGSVAARTLVMRQMDALGLTIAGMRMNRWTIATEPEARPQHDRGDPASIKERLKLVDSA